LNQADVSDTARRAEARLSHTIIAWQEYDVNTYLYGKNRSIGG
jgi:hypothetical protein